uniref:Uncharacterized protein n=1 Tax=Ralstonia solanacearum TaxID=305 RepID=A0A0S4VEK8_RALSL|nr:protein of unknown function [Ralstonia solanacearum]CUV24317.1 protein of unknown function [Ralstonia solanacearum]CUV28997.1 protein of unknown function [Ralstonia solanacearum]CUV32488.1 protein of unknown function [Ralstonia solanacearum]CUV38646.1 protein of unknown function [Ralstonia solanacearum]
MICWYSGLKVGAPAPTPAGDAPASPPGDGGTAAELEVEALDIAVDFTTKAIHASSPFIECLMSYIRQKIR